MYRGCSKKQPINDSVRLLDGIVKEMDLSALYRAYERHGRPAATAPSTMLKVLLYAGMEKIHSAGEIETACRRDINFIWLLNGAKAPNYHEIARFSPKELLALSNRTPISDSFCCVETEK